MMKLTTARISIFGILLSLTLSSVAAAETSLFRFRLQADPATVPTDSAFAVSAFLQDTAAKLPPRLQTTLGRTIQVRFIDLGGDAILPSCAPAAKSTEAIRSRLLGRLPALPWTDLQHASVVELHRGFLPIIASGPEAADKFPCGHRSLYRLAQATILHELAHLFDYSDLWSPEERRELARCRAQGPRKESPDPKCLALRNIRGQISDRPGFRNRVEWFRGVLTDGPKNQLLTRSPDPYEYRNPQENFAVNFEYFALDPDFACRRPALHDFYAKTFGHPGAADPSRPCAPNRQIRYANSGLAAQLDPSRVYQVHYLFAGQGKETMSRWGHAMYRLVMCAPERPFPSEDCLKDTSYHVVVSYRANISDLILSSFKGLTGGYPSQIFFFSLPEIVEEYTREELRDLTSYPLRLSDQQKALLLAFLSEQYWQYSGRYYFLSNNCATEARDALTAILPVDHALQSEPLLTPLGLRNAVIRTGLADASPLHSREQARLQGLYFPSHRANLEKALNTLRELTGLTTRDLPPDALAYFKRYNAAERQSLYRKFPPSRKLAAAFYLLESQARRVATARLQTLGAVLLENPSELPPSYSEIRTLQQIQTPWRQIRTDAPGYGVPLESELLPLEELMARYQTYWNSLKTVTDWIDKRLPEQSAEISTIGENLRFFSEELKKQP